MCESKVNFLAARTLWITYCSHGPAGITPGGVLGNSHWLPVLVGYRPRLTGRKLNVPGQTNHLDKDGDLESFSHQ